MMGPLADLDNTLTELDNTLDTVELLIRELQMSLKNEAKCIDMLYAMYEMAEAAALEVDTQ